MAKYFYIYNVAGSKDAIVRMYNTEAVKDGKVYTAFADKVVSADKIDGFVDGIKASGFVGNKELADAEVAEQEAKRILAEKMNAYHEARDAYSEAADNLKKVKAKYGI